jgi:N-acetylneuraminate epimerase
VPCACQHAQTADRVPVCPVRPVALRQTGRAAHDGLKKGWRDEVYVYDKAAEPSGGKASGGKIWREVGKLPTGLAYGASFPLSGGLLIVGGEDGEATPRREVFLMKWDGKALSIEH